MKKTYVEPSIKLIQRPQFDVGMYLWLQSRNKVLSHLDGTPIQLDFELSEFTDEFEFKVGNEVVKYKEYRERIQDMNLQYNNSIFYLFEINGSCLFRDMCYNINTTSQWAESNRFLFSILDENARFESEHYHISGEYKDIPEWEAQFETYMNKIREVPIVDVNRLEMPYSISSRFWLGITHSQLCSFLGYMKVKTPFFYNVYGKKIIKLLSIKESKLPSCDNPLIEQYKLPVRELPALPLTEENGTVFINTDMGLILYSQFIRQTGTTIQGLFNILEHEDADQFSHEVFKGDTTFKIQYIANINKLYRTISNRLCAFAMSSGDGPCSWNHILKLFVDEVGPETFKKWLPCKFHGNQLINCKFYDDVKFRTEGKEISNIPCPLVTLSDRDAIAKKERDQNSIGDRFYELTQDLKYNGLRPVIDMKAWTSDLMVYADKDLEVSDIESGITQDLTSIECDYIQLKHKAWNLFQSNGILSNFLCNYASIDLPGGDPTCLMKGWAIDEVIFRQFDMDNVTINFGGDIFTTVGQTIQIEGTKFSIQLSDPKIFNDGTWAYSVFTSSNLGKRGNHIVDYNGDYNRLSVTVIVRWTRPGLKDNVLVDALATKCISKEFDQINKLLNQIRQLGGDVNTLVFDANGKLQSPTYCASPFFNPEQVEIRDNMLSELKSYFRPDETESSIRYADGDDSMVNEVVDDNILGIQVTEYLVFPNRTTDLGTLYEVGLALGLGHPIIKYDEKSKLYTVCITSIKHLEDGKSYIFDCSKKSDCIALGAASLLLNPKDSPMAYCLNGAKDNIMLSTRHQHYEKVNNKWIRVERSLNERDS